ncbi:hypothetical protein PVA45_05275 [Entomospira entomophila]|uniref:Uncharacterized protein n=1 Tax=Entomospira entomophila TaxID=2719988 RepID=A0A968G983_9SPIO|nr:hypothetical protein [Entomospira entomophilus]NIZ40910.1 hypothetical protein [Entomospira entomophilus]WDI35123.1 hypothetical protein PVA45_05275 [Entomospira entomophilus]
MIDDSLVLNPSSPILYTLTAPSNSPYEQYIHRHADASSVRIDLRINEKTEWGGNLWISAVQAVRPGAQVVIDPRRIGAGTPTILFNWFKGEVGYLEEPNTPSGIRRNQALPLIIPVSDHTYDFFPRENVILYDIDVNESSVSIDYNSMIRNLYNQNGAGSLDRAQAWRGSSERFQAGDTVDLVFLLYRTVEDYEWYQETIVHDGGDPLQRTTIDHFIELQRIPVVLKE